MNWKDIKSKVGQAAPFLGTLVGGPAGAAIGKLVSVALNTDDDPDAVAMALESPEKVAELRQWAMAHKERLEDIAFNTLKVELKDKADARKNHKQSKMPAVITVLLTGLVVTLLYLLFENQLPNDNKEIAFLLIGQVSALWGASITYWVGTTRSSAEKTAFANLREIVSR